MKYLEVYWLELGFNLGFSIFPDEGELHLFCGIFAVVFGWKWKD